MKRILLPLLFGCLALSAAPLRAADEKEESADSKATLDEVKLGDVIMNGPVTAESLKGKAVVLEFWGIH